MVHWRVHMVHQWCTYGVEGVYIWYSRCVCIWYTGVYISYTGGVHMVQQVCTCIWCTRCVHMVQRWRTYGAPVVYIWYSRCVIWYTSGVHMVHQVWTYGAPAVCILVWCSGGNAHPHPPPSPPHWRALAEHCRRLQGGGGGGEGRHKHVAFGSDSLAEWSKALQAPVRKGVGSNPTAVTFYLSPISWFSASPQGVCA